MLRKTQEKDAPWAIQLIDLYLCTSDLFTSVPEELAALPPGTEKMCSLYLNLALKHAQWSDYAVRLLFYNVLHLLFSTRRPSANKKKVDTTLRARVIDWCSYFKTIAQRMTDTVDSQRILKLVDDLPSLFR